MSSVASDGLTSEDGTYFGVQHYIQPQCADFVVRKSPIQTSGSTWLRLIQLAEYTGFCFCGLDEKCTFLHSNIAVVLPLVMDLWATTLKNLGLRGQLANMLCLRMHYSFPCYPKHERTKQGGCAKPTRPRWWFLRVWFLADPDPKKNKAAVCLEWNHLHYFCIKKYASNLKSSVCMLEVADTGGSLVKATQK